MNPSVSLMDVQYVNLPNPTQVLSSPSLLGASLGLFAVYLNVTITDGAAGIMGTIAATLRDPSDNSPLVGKVGGWQFRTPAVNPTGPFFVPNDENDINSALGFWSQVIAGVQGDYSSTDGAVELDFVGSNSSQCRFGVTLLAVQ